MSSWKIYHGNVICSKIESKIVYNKALSIIHSIVSGLLIVIIDLIIIVMNRTHQNGDT
jgi:uncharacterized integral membrane protein